MRKLKFHEKKLLKKTNFLLWKREGGHREAAVTQRYSLVDRDDYKKYILSIPSLPLLLPIKHSSISRLTVLIREIVASAGRCPVINQSCDCCVAAGTTGFA